MRDKPQRAVGEKNDGRMRTTTTDVAMAKASGKFTTRMTSLIMIEMLESPAPPSSWISVEVPSATTKTKRNPAITPGMASGRTMRRSVVQNAGAEILARADHRGLDPREDQHHRHDGERQVGGDHADHHGEIGEEQPLDRLVDDAEADERVVDDARPAEHEPPGEGADQRASEERNGEEHDERSSRAAARSSGR